MVRSVGQLKWSRTIQRKHDLSQDILLAWALERRPTGQRRDPGIAGQHTRSLGRQRRIRGTRADDDPVLVIAGLGRQDKCTGESCACGEFDRVSAVRIVQCSLQIAACANQGGAAWRRRVGQRGLHVSQRQLRRTVRVSAGWWRWWRGNRQRESFAGGAVSGISGLGSEGELPSLRRSS